MNNKISHYDVYLLNLFIFFKQTNQTQRRHIMKQKLYYKNLHFQITILHFINLNKQKINFQIGKFRSVIMIIILQVLFHIYKD